MPAPGDAGALSFAAVALADADRDIAAIACYTRTGRTARILSALRPRVPILAFTSEREVLGQMPLVHGVVPADLPAARRHRRPARADGLVARGVARRPARFGGRAGRVGRGGGHGVQPARDPSRPGVIAGTSMPRPDTEHLFQTASFR